MLQIEQEAAARQKIRVRFHIIRNGRIENEGKYQSCMFFKLRIIWKQTVSAGFVHCTRTRRRNTHMVAACLHARPRLCSFIRGLKSTVARATFWLALAAAKQHIMCRRHPQRQVIYIRFNKRAFCMTKDTYWPAAGAGGAGGDHTRVQRIWGAGCRVVVTYTIVPQLIFAGVCSYRCVSR